MMKYSLSVRDLVNNIYCVGINFKPVVSILRVYCLGCESVLVVI